MDKPEALRLADALDRLFIGPAAVAAAELRRLSAVEAQRDALLEAMKEIHQATMRNGIVIAKDVGINAVAGMAIAAVEGEKA